MSDICPREWLVLGLFMATCFAVVAVVSAWSMPGVDSWYLELERPSWNPPGWVFGPVWSVLYVSMAVAAWMVWRKGGLRLNAIPLALFGLQLGLNVCWPVMFFRLRSPAGAFVEIIALWVAIATTLWAFMQRSRLAGWLMMPYLAWVTFAAMLNLAIWRMNV